MCFAYEVVKARLDARPRREEISFKVTLLCLGCHVLRSMCSSAIRLSCRMSIVRLRVLMMMPSFLRT